MFVSFADQLLEISVGSAERLQGVKPGANCSVNRLKQRGAV